jgi:hypothetical protein
LSELFTDGKAADGAAAPAAAAPAAAPVAAAAPANESAADKAKRLEAEKAAAREEKRKKERDAEIAARQERDQKNAIAAAAASGHADSDTAAMLIGGSKKKKGTDKKTYDFWDTQPVPKISDKPADHAEIEKKTIEQVMKDPYPLPGGYEWCSVDMNDKKQVRRTHAHRRILSAFSAAVSVRFGCLIGSYSPYWQW